MIKSRSNLGSGVLLACLAAMMPSLAQAQYSVGGVVIGQPVPSNLSGQGYACIQSEDFPGLKRCERRRGPRGEMSVILHTADGTAVYVLSHEAPVTLSSARVKAEIDALSGRLGRRPADVAWQNGQDEKPTAVIARWGEVRLDGLGREEEQALEEGNGASLGVLADVLGDPARSASEGKSVYRLVGGQGVVYTASFEQATGGIRRIAAIDAAGLLRRRYESELQFLFHKDRSLGGDDFSLWPQVAERTRRLARDTSVSVADNALYGVSRAHPSKLASYVWTRLPGSVIEGLSAREYRPGVDHYGPKSKFPALRDELQSYVRTNPSDPFIEFAHYALGDPDAGLLARPNSTIRGVLHYAIAHRILRKLARDAIEVARSRSETVPRGFYDSSERMAFINGNPQMFDNRPISQVVDGFAARARAARPHLLAALEDPKAPLADDAAYFLGFLDFHEGSKETALRHFERAMVVGNGDYKTPAAMKQAIRILMSYPAGEQIRIVEGSEVFSIQAPLVYVAARSAYREHDYALVVGFLERALPKLKIPVDRIPSTTDPRRIEQALRRIIPQDEIDSEGYDFSAELHLSEMFYLLEAAREMLQYVNFVRSMPAENPDPNLSKRARAIILKYSMILDEKKDEDGRRRPGTELQHKDLRQAVHLIDVTLEKTPRNARFKGLREWLQYRKLRALTAYKPDAVSGVVAALRGEAPDSKLADDAMAEQMFVEGLVLLDIGAAERTFQSLQTAYPGANAVDNAHSWMAISYYCLDRKTDAQRIDREIIRRFPLSRHALYAGKRLTSLEDGPAPGMGICLREELADSDPDDADDVENLPCRYIMNQEICP